MACRLILLPSTSLAEAFERYCKRLRKDEDGKNNHAIVQAEDELAAIIRQFFEHEEQDQFVENLLENIH